MSYRSYKLPSSLAFKHRDKVPSNEYNPTQVMNTVNKEKIKKSNTMSGEEDSLTTRRGTTQD